MAKKWCLRELNSGKCVNCNAIVMYASLNFSAVCVKLCRLCFADGTRQNGGKLNLSFYLNAIIPHKQLLHSY